MIKIGGKEFDTTHQAYIMGILNITPDSFADGGKYNAFDAALRHVEQMIEEGAAIIDVGGESTRPGYQQISAQEEIERVAPVIEKIKTRFDTIISVDTYKSEVARECIALGADMINDIWGLKYIGNNETLDCHRLEHGIEYDISDCKRPEYDNNDCYGCCESCVSKNESKNNIHGMIHNSEMAHVIADSGCACCLMHNNRSDYYENFIEDVLNDMKETLQIAEQAGIKSDKIILDPGIGFAKRHENNLEMIGKLDQLCSLGYPVLLGTSRKSVVGLTLELPVSERLEGTLAATVIGRLKGASFFRVHDVQENIRALKMTDAIKRLM